MEFFMGGGYSDSRKRDIKIDLLKGMGIFLMVLRHTEAPYSEFVLLFHMAVFFIASGYLFDSAKIIDLKSLIGYIIKKIKGLWVPYFGFMTTFVLLHNYFLKINIITDNPQYLTQYTGRYAMLSEYYSLKKILKEIIKSSLFRGNEQMGGALWFFNTLFLLMVGYAVIGYIIKRIYKPKNRIIYIQGILSIVFLMIGYYLHICGKSVYGLNRFFSFYCLVFIGQIMRGRLEDIYKKTQPVILFVVTMIILVVLRPLGYIDLSGNNIENPVYFLTVSISGWFMMYSLTVILERIHFRGNEIIVYLSVHAVPIIGLHFMSFKLVNWIGIQLNSMEEYMIAAFPVLLHGTWWIAYLFAGVAIPLITNMIYMSCKKRMTDNITT